MLVNSNQSICLPRPLKIVQSTCLLEVVSFAMLSYAEYAHMIGPSSSTSLHLSSLSTQDIRVTSIQYSHGSAPEKFTASSSKFNLSGRKVSKKNTLQSHGRLYRWAGPRKPEDLVVRQKQQASSKLIDKEDNCTYVVASKVVDLGLGKHGVVFQLGLAQRRGVAGDDDELGLSGAESLEGGFVSESDCEGAS